MPPHEPSPSLIEQQGAAIGALTSDEIVVLRRLLHADPPELDRLARHLDAAERATAARYHFERDRRQSIVSRGFLRELLGELLGVAPASVRLGVGAHGKPALEPTGADLAFNVSHAGQHLYVAVARGRALGVDVEGGDRTLEIDELAPTVFTAQERAELAAFPSEARRAAFLRGWTRKEAYLKARSVGLSLPLRDFSVTLADAHEVALTSDVDPAEAARFRLRALPAAAEYAATVAWERGSPVRRIRLITAPGSR